MKRATEGTRTAADHLVGALTGGWERALSQCGGLLADARVKTVCVTPLAQP